MHPEKKVFEGVTLVHGVIKANDHCFDICYFIFIIIIGKGKRIT